MEQYGSQIQHKEKKGGLWKKLLFVLLSLVVIVVIALLDPNFSSFGDVLMRMEPYWLLLAFASMLSYYFFDTVMYQFACRFMECPQRLADGIITTMLGYFYSALTPFSSGGQPMQVLQMRRRGMKVGVATSVLMLKFLAWQIIVTLLGILGFIFLGESILNGGATMLIMYIIGFIANAGCVFLAAMVLLKPDWVFVTGEKLLDFLHRHRLIKKDETTQNAHEAWAKTIGDYKDAVHFALQHTKGMLLILLAAAIEAVSYMAVTYFIYRGMGLADVSFLHIVLLQGMLYVAVSFVPLPGASIASEGGFYLMFTTLFTPAMRFPAMLIWRIITYYATIVLGFFAVIADTVMPVRYTSRGNVMQKAAPDGEQTGEPAAPPRADDSNNSTGAEA